jgi:cytidine deaminase
MDRARGGGSVTAETDRLLAAAREARANAYAPYSRYRVGAALLTRNGDVFAGCNVENATFGATLCAERAAVAAMIAAGGRDPIACMVLTSGREPGTPCGICRQVLSEFGRDIKVLSWAEDDRGRVASRKTFRLSALLPHCFSLEVGDAVTVHGALRQAARTRTRTRTRRGGGGAASG